MAPLESGLLVQVVHPWLLVSSRHDWPQWLFALGHAGAAAACVAAARRVDARSARVLTAVSVLLIGLALIDLYRADTLIVYLVRHVALLQGWYDVRRLWQGLALLVVFGMLLHVGVRWWRSASTHRVAGMGRVWLGVAILVALFLMRLVSLHHTDWLLDVRIAAISVGRWVTVVGLLLVASGSRRMVGGE